MLGRGRDVELIAKTGHVMMRKAENVLPILTNWKFKGLNGVGIK